MKRAIEKFPAYTGKSISEFHEAIKKQIILS